MSLSLDTPQAAPSAPEKRFKWSASRLKRLLQCPRQFRYVYLDGLPTVATAPQVFGQTMHHVVCHAHEQHMTGGAMPPVADLITDFDVAWSQALKQKQPLFRANHPDVQRFTTMGHQMLRAFHTRHAALPVPLAVELPFEIEVTTEANGGGVTLCGIIDRVDETTCSDGSPALVVVDYKSGSKKPSATELESDLQLTVYAFAASRFLGLPVERVEVHFLRDVLELPAHRTANGAEWLVTQAISHAERALEREHFPPRPGFWCRWCEFQAQCQAEGLHETATVPTFSPGEVNGLCS